MRHTTKALPLETRVRLFWAFGTIAVLSLVVYIYAINMTVHNTVSRQALQIEIAALSSHVSELEFAVISQKNTVSLDLALNRGFKEVTEPHFISRSSGTTLSMNTLKR